MPFYGPPLDRFKELVKRSVDACNGLPLSLKVIGGQLYGISRKNYWESQLDKLSRVLHKDVKETLKVSYDALDNEEKEMFLDTACFFIGEERDLAIDVWDGSGWSGLHGWERLVSMFLVELDEDNCIRMHDHLRDLGREIASKQSSHRLWSTEQIINAQIQLAEKKLDIRGIRAITAGSSSELQLGLCGLAASSPLLKFFVTKYYSNQIIEKFVSRELVWLRCEGHRSISSPLSLRNLRVLELQSLQDNCDMEELWQAEGDAPLQLRQLTIRNYPKVQTSIIKSIGRLKHLKKIVVDGRLNLTSLPQEFCLLQSLEHLELKHWELEAGYGCKISSLPSRFGDLRNLRHLQLSWWEELRMLPVSFKQLTLLNHLGFYKCSKLTIKSDIFENMRMLQYLSFKYCGELQELPRHITNQVSLRELFLGGTSIREVPNDIGELSKLREMEIGSELLTSLPTSLGNLSSLTNLVIKDCPKLEALPESMGNLSSLSNLTIKDCLEFEALSESMGNLSSLTNFTIEDCPELEALPESMGNLSSLTTLHIRNCFNLECLPDSLGRLNQLRDLSINNAGVKNLVKSVRELINLQTLSIWCCSINELNFGPESFQLCDLKRLDLSFTQVSKISISEDCCPGLETLKLYKEHRLMEIESLPRTVKEITLKDCKMVKNIRGIGGLVNLQKLRISECPELDELPSFAELASLKEFELKSCYKVEKIEGVQHCRSLEVLIAHSRWEVAGIESLEQMEGLRRLQLTTFKKRSAIEPCIQTLQKWPEEIAICTKAVRNAGSLVNSFAFQKLESFFSDNSPRLVQKRFSNAGEAIMVCFVINCVSSSHTAAEIRGDYLKFFEMELEEGKWVWIGVFTQPSTWVTSKTYGIFKNWQKENECEVEKGVVAMGEEKSIVEAFHTLFTLLGS